MTSLDDDGEDFVTQTRIISSSCRLTSGFAPNHTSLTFARLSDKRNFHSDNQNLIFFPRICDSIGFTIERFVDLGRG
jgi:hypothetical protein